MRAITATLAVVWALLLCTGSIAAASTGSASRSLQRTLSRDLRHARGTSGALVVDLTTGRTLYSLAASTPRLPASVEKLYTTSTALLRFGPNTRLSTSVLGVGSFDADHVWHGTLYLRGGGDPTFGSASFDRYAYGTGATVQQLVANLIRQSGITGIQGSIVGDESYFDSLRGTAPYGYKPAGDIEGLLSALVFDRGLANEQGTAFQRRPALFTAQQFATALSAAGVQVPKRTRIYTGPTPSGAQLLGTVHSPRISWLIKLTNTPSDNFLAEMLLKGIGAAFGGAGSTAAGAAVVQAQMAGTFGIDPTVTDGSGLSRSDATTPAQVVALLKAQLTNAPFVNSLAVAGESGTMQIGLQGTAAQGRCQGKTGTLSDVANLVGYCTASDGHRLAFAFLMNSVDPTTGHALEDRMAVALARYNG